MLIVNLLLSLHLLVGLLSKLRQRVALGLTSKVLLGNCLLTHVLYHFLQSFFEMIELDQVCLQVNSRGCGLIPSMNSSASLDCEEAKEVLFRLTQR